MNKPELDLLEKVFEAEIDAAVSGGLGLYQTKSKLAQQLASDGYLAVTQAEIGGRFPVAVKGYRLTLLGNATYCLSDRCIEDAVTPNTI